MFCWGTFRLAFMCVVNFWDAPPKQSLDQVHCLMATALSDGCDSLAGQCTLIPQKLLRNVCRMVTKSSRCPPGLQIPQIPFWTSILGVSLPQPATHMPPVPDTTGHQRTAPEVLCPCLKGHSQAHLWWGLHELSWLGISHRDFGGIWSQGQSWGHSWAFFVVWQGTLPCLGSNAVGKCCCYRSVYLICHAVCVVDVSQEASTWIPGPNFSLQNVAL